MKKLVLCGFLFSACLAARAISAAAFSFGELKLDCPEPGDWKISVTREVAADGAEIARIVLDAPKPTTPPVFAVQFGVPQVGLHYRWSVNGSDVSLPPIWLTSNYTELGNGMPLNVFFDGNGESRLSVAASECDRRLRFDGGVRDKGSLIEHRITYFSTPEAPLTRYETLLRIDRVPRAFPEAVRRAVAWIEAAGGYKPCEPPEAAFDPLYSTWYNFHQAVTAKDVEAECAIAAKLGLKTVILDDGWQTDDPEAGYSTCGDWKPSKHFPDMRAHVGRVQAMGMKYLLWYSMPFVGPKSDNYARFKGKYLMHKWGNGVLDPRFPEVRRFLVDTYVNAMKDWGVDGFKLDFIDSFAFGGEDPAVKENYAGRDMKSLPLAVNRLMREVRDALTAINPDVLLEFRQRYVGPAIRRYGNMLRVFDCPGDMRRNRIAIANLRLASGRSAVHADMLEWNFAETPEAAARFIVNALFGVVQYSVMLRDAPAAHRAVIEKWLRFSQAHRETLLKGSFTPHHPELHYPVIEAESADERVIGVYQDGCVVDVSDDKRTFLANASGSDRIVVRRRGKLETVVCKDGDWIELK